MRVFFSLFFSFTGLLSSKQSTKKWSVPGIVALFSTFNVFAADPFYNGLIYSVPSESKELNASLQDFTSYLSKICGKNFLIKGVSKIESGGIHVLQNKPGLLPDAINKQLSRGSIEDFVLSGDEKKLWIVANHPLGLSRGIYTYLDNLGVKWYYPGEKWEHYKTVSSIIYLGVDYFSPSMNVRNFFGTGGIRPMPPLDPEGTIRKEWEDWKRRNRMGGEIDPGGHTGEYFNLMHRQVLETHPEYLALINNKRVAWSESAKWCVSNKNLRNLIIAARIKELTESLNRSKNSNEKILISVEPSDGGGECECNDCKKIGSIANRYFLLANEVAREFAKISPRAYVNLYAYNTHPEPPSLAIEPNIIVVIIPYAFQSYGTPQHMINAWKKKRGNLLIYDYYNIPDWQYEVPLPRKTSVDSLINRLIYWKKAGISGFHLESVYGTALSGLGLYIASRIGWNAGENTAQIKKQFYQNMFGSAASEMEMFFDYINNNYSDAIDLPYLRNILIAVGKGATSKVASRVTDFEAYIHYLSLYHQWQSVKNKKGKEWEELVQFVWEIYPLHIIHSTRIADLFFYQLNDADPLFKSWSVGEPYGTKLQKVRFADDREISKLTKKDAEINPQPEGLSYGKKKFFNYLIGPVTKKVPTANEVMILGGNFPQTFIKPSAGKFNFSIKLNDETISPIPVTINCIDTTTNSVAYSKIEMADKNWTNISLKLPVNKTYKLSLEFKDWIRFRFSFDQWMGFRNIPTYGVMNDLWFYVPPNTSYIYYSNDQTDQPVFKNGQGKNIPSEKFNTTGVYRVRSLSSKGEWWTISSSQYKILKFYYQPDLFFLHSDYNISKQ